MKIKTEFPYKIIEIENTWIPLSDGSRLAARIWTPEDAEQNPVPALFEYLPYRKNDGTAIRDALRQPYLAGHGYAAVRVDMRGSGDSDGILYDEYLPQEQDDALEVISWIAEQPWCDGNIGMHGISWGGFNSLQVAARQPPALKAILVIGFTDDRYNDDVHYMGGCVLTSQMLPWASVMFAYNATPPDPRFAGECWREMWLERMEKSPPFVHAWVAHQRKDAYWKHGSVGENYNAIKVPVYAVGGWADSYNNSIPRLLAGLSVPRKGLIGPWAHRFPESGIPGLAIGFLQESLRWWDTWLKGIDTGIMDEPTLLCWIQDSVPPASYYPERSGHWVADPSWPSPFVREHTYFLNSNGASGTLDEKAAPEQWLKHRGTLRLGFEGGDWGGYGNPGDHPADQRSTDGQSLTFTSTPLENPVEILGNPEVELTLAVDQPLALVAVRLCDVAPTGESILVTWGLLNLTHRDSHENPTSLEPGKSYIVRVPLNVIGHRFQACHRIRVGISSTYVRHAWPSPKLVTLSLSTGTSSKLRLPVRTPQPGDAHLPLFQPPETAPVLSIETLRTSSRQQTLERDMVGEKIVYKQIEDKGRVRFPGNGIEVDKIVEETFTISETDPLSASQHIHSKIAYQRGEWEVRIETDSHLTADEEHFYLSNHLDAYEGSTRVFSKSWDRTIPRDLA